LSGYLKQERKAGDFSEILQGIISYTVLRVPSCDVWLLLRHPKQQLNNSTFQRISRKNYTLHNTKFTLMQKLMHISFGINKIKRAFKRVIAFGNTVKYSQTSVQSLGYRKPQRELLLLSKRKSNSSQDCSLRCSALVLVLKRPCATFGV
jgi:hypothetical protein